jgi:hypothetical protein
LRHRLRSGVDAPLLKLYIYPRAAELGILRSLSSDIIAIRKLCRKYNVVLHIPARKPRNLADAGEGVCQSSILGGLISLLVAHDSLTATLMGAG